MKGYKDIPIWENIKRINLLNEFKDLVTKYSENLRDIQKHEQMMEINPQIEDNNRVIRSNINKLLKEEHKIILSSGVSLMVYYAPPPTIGGIAGYMDIIDNIFILDDYNIELIHVIDIIEQSLGVYENDKIGAWIRTINPFFWLFKILDYIASIPFVILGKAGFNQKKAENSFLGKTVKAIITLIAVCAGILTILDKLDYLDWFKRALLRR